MTKPITKILTSSAQTQALAQELLTQNLKNLKEKALLFALEGDLGAGKTTFTQGVGEILKVGRPIRSPGYILVTEYDYHSGNLIGQLFHIDLWRVQDEEEVRTLGIPQLLKPGNIVVVEWAHKVPDFIAELAGDPQKVKAVRLHFDYIGENERKVQIYELN